MCGLFGAIVTRANGVDWTEVIRTGLRAIRHRGPDGEGLYVSPRQASGPSAFLGHVRLAIIDLESGQQPMLDHEGDLAISYNGEIYNFLILRDELARLGYRFRTHSDTEVILCAYREWGDACLTRLNGMFAFALWDNRKKRLLLARDRFGEKPLFYATFGSTLLFASEIKAFKAVPGFQPTLDGRALISYLEYRYVPGPHTLLQEVRKLQPGGYMVWEDGKVEEALYYRPPDRMPAKPSTAADPVAAFRDRLGLAVRMRMISDVPFGAFLSGGIDSSTIVGLMAEHSSTPVKTFSVGFREQDYSELRFARLVAEHFATDHHELEVSQDELIEHLPSLVDFRDAPVSEPSDIPIYLLAREAHASVKMVLTGEGSDEVLGGYPKHVFERWVPLYQQLPKTARRSLVEPLVNALPYGFSRAKTAIRNLGIERDEERMPGWFGAMSPDDLESITALRPPRNGSDLALQFDVAPATSSLRRILYFDQTSWLPDNLLERGDRMTMAASIEARLPFLDHELVALASALPDRYRVRGATTKWILRRAAAEVLPKTILERPKVGFRLPVNEWFRGSMREYLRAHLCAPDSAIRSYLRTDTLDRRLKEHFEGRHNHEKLIWTLLNLEIWLRTQRSWVHL